jgi:cytoskeleton protein RodZ
MGGHQAVLHDRRSNLAEGQTMMSPVGNDYAEAGFAQAYPRSGVGNDLRETRERLGWSLPAVAASLRIRLPYLEAIEAGRFSELPGNAYAVGFVRTYAGAMGLDTDEIARRFRAEAADVNRKTDLTFPAPVPERGVPAGAVVLLSVVLIVVAYMGWYRFSGERQPAAQVVPVVPERLVAAIEPPPVPVAIKPVVAVPPPVAVPPVQPPAADGGRIVVRAKSEAWVQVRDKQGTVIFNRTMRAGETWPVPGRQALLLTVGNAGGTDILVDGIVAPSLGADGVVRRDVPLDADQLRDGKLAAVPPVAAKLPAPKQP